MALPRKEVIPFFAQCKNHYELEVIALMSTTPVEKKTSPSFSL